MVRIKFSNWSTINKAMHFYIALEHVWARTCNSIETILLLYFWNIFAPSRSLDGPNQLKTHLFLVYYMCSINERKIICVHVQLCIYLKNVLSKIFATLFLFLTLYCINDQHENAQQNVFICLDTPKIAQLKFIWLYIYTYTYIQIGTRHCQLWLILGLEFVSIILKNIDNYLYFR